MAALEQKPKTSKSDLTDLVLADGLGLHVGSCAVETAVPIVTIGGAEHGISLAGFAVHANQVAGMAGYGRVGDRVRDGYWVSKSVCCGKMHELAREEKTERARERVGGIMAASSSPPAVARPSGDSHHRHPKRDVVVKRKRRDSSKHRKRYASSSDAAASSSSASSSSSSASSDSDSGSSQSNTSSSSEDHRSRRSQRRSSKRKHHHHRDESSSDSDSDGSERSRKHRRRDSSKKVKERRKEGSKHKDKKHKRKEKSKKDGAGPVQLSKFLGRGKDNGVRRSVVSGKKIQMKVEKSKEDKLAETNRMELLKFLNSSYD